MLNNDRQTAVAALSIGATRAFAIASAYPPNRLVRWMADLLRLQTPATKNNSTMVRLAPHFEQARP